MSAPKRGRARTELRVSGRVGLEPELQQQRYPQREVSTHRGTVGHTASHSCRFKSIGHLRTGSIVVKDFRTKQVLTCVEECLENLGGFA